MKTNLDYIHDFINKHKKDDGILKHLSFVFSIAKMYSDKNPFLDFVDIFQVGVIGLLSAEKYFNKKHNVKFISYAVRAIKNNILVYISNSNFKFKIPSYNYINIIKEYCSDDNIENKKFSYLLDLDNYTECNDDTFLDCNKEFDSYSEYKIKEIKTIILNIVSKMSENNKKMFKYGIMYDDKRFDHYKHKNKYYKARAYELFKKEFLKILRRDYGIKYYNDVKGYFDG